MKARTQTDHSSKTNVSYRERLRILPYILTIYFVIQLGIHLGWDNLLPALCFYLASTLILVFTLPLGWHLFPKSSAHLGIYSRIAGLLFTNFVVWWLAVMGIVGFTVVGILFSMLLVTALGVGLCRKQRIKKESYLQWWKRHRSSLLFDEVVFGLSFLAFVLFTSHRPDIYGQEKYMDFAFLNSLMRSPTLPPPRSLVFGGDDQLLLRWVSGHGTPRPA